MNDNKTRVDPVEYSLRTSWQSIRMMYHEEAVKYGLADKIIESREVDNKE